MPRSTIVAVTCLAVALAGCQVSTSPRVVARLADRQAPSMTTAPWDGAYALFRLPDDPKAARAELQHAHLRKGEPLGFRTRETALVVAVAGDLEVPVQAGRYEWVMRPDPNQIDPGTTTMFVVVMTVFVAAAAFGAYVAYVGNDFSNNFLHRDRK